MTEAQMELLFDEFATRYVRGERPDVGDYLERAGSEREQLGRLIDRFLEAVPARPPTEEEVVLMQSRLEAEPPLLLLRLRRKLSREAVADALVKRLGLDPAKSDKVGGYYHDLEVGNLDPDPVDRRVWEILSDVLKANVRGLAGVRPEPPLAPAAAYMREPTGMQAKLEHAPASPAEPDAKAPDEIDGLFTAGARTGSRSSSLCASEVGRVRRWKRRPTASRRSRPSSTSRSRPFRITSRS